MLRLYRNIKKLRIDHGLSQDELAVLAGYKNRSSIARIERGDVDVPQSAILKFAEIFGVSPGDLMGWDEDEGEEFSPEEKSIIYRYRMLNRKGKTAGMERLDELIQLPKFTEFEESNREEDCD